MNNNENFWNNNLEKGYYDKLISNGLASGRSLQANWHNCTYLNVKKYISSHDRHLDYACGSGTFIGRYLYSNSVGTDISENQIEYAVENFGGKNKFYKISEFKKNNTTKYDVITILGLIEFLDEDDLFKLFQNLDQLIVADGKIIITTPNFSKTFSLVQKISKVLGVKNYDSVTVNKFNKKSLSKILENNFSEVKIKKIVNPGLFASVVNNKLGLFGENFFKHVLFHKFGFILLAIVKK
mgnify:FL=1|tara:strand:+ start:10047 stop:10763 length:717 start_codon:yes stop_codon:yes gene_type:complete